MKSTSLITLLLSALHWCVVNHWQCAHEQHNNVIAQLLTVNLGGQTRDDSKKDNLTTKNLDLYRATIVKFQEERQRAHTIGDSRAEATAAFNEAHTWEMLGDTLSLREAENAYRLAISAANAGNDPGQRSMAANNLGVILVSEQRITEALAAYRNIDFSSVGDEERVVFYFNVGRAQELSGSLNEAFSNYLAALELKSIFSPALEGAFRTIFQQQTLHLDQITVLAGYAARNGQEDLAYSNLLQLLRKWGDQPEAQTILVALQEVYTAKQVDRDIFQNRELPILSKIAEQHPRLLFPVSEIQNMYSAKLPLLPSKTNGLFSSLQQTHDASYSNGILAEALSHIATFYVNQDQPEMALGRYGAAWNLTHEPRYALEYLSLLSQQSVLDPSGKFLEDFVDWLLMEDSDNHSIKEWTEIRRLHVALATILEQLNKCDSANRVKSAIFQWQRAIVADAEERKNNPLPPSPGLHEHLGNCYYVVGNHQLAALEWYNAGRQFHEVDDNDKALELLNAGLKLEGAQSDLELQSLIAKEVKNIGAENKQTHSFLVHGSEMQPVKLLPSSTGQSSLQGTVTDPLGAAIAGSTVTITNSSNGIAQQMTTDSRGFYRFALVVPGHYIVEVVAAGFKTAKQGLELGGAQQGILDCRLWVAQASEVVEVTSDAPLLDVVQSYSSTTLDSKTIADLPINRRDYLTFSVLAPGSNGSTRIGSEQDLRAKQIPQSGLSLYGGNEQSNSVTVDGRDANYDSGARGTTSTDTVAELQINRNNYSAELGAGGVAMNIISKTGSNDLHGSVFGFFRNDVFDARNPFAVTHALQPGQVFNPASGDSSGSPTRDDLSRQQFGVTVGFPIVKDKTFVFAAFEALRQNAQNAAPLLTDTTAFRPNGGQEAIIAGLLNQPNNSVPCLTGGGTVPSALCAQILNNALTISQFNGLTTGQTARNLFLVNQFENNGGIFAYQTRQYQLSARLDHNFSDNDKAYLRYNFVHDLDSNPDVQSLTGFSRGSAIHAYNNTAQAAWFHQFSVRTQNEARFQFIYSDFNVVPNEPGEVGLDIAGLANLGTNIFLPSFTIMRRYEVADNFIMVRGKHTIKLGGFELYRGNHSESHTFLSGRFVFGSLPGGILSPCLANPAIFCSTSPNSPLNSAFPQTLNSLQSVSLGLPQFYQQGFGNPVLSYRRPLVAGYAQDSWAIVPNFTFNFGLRYELDAQSGRLNTDKDNFGPRASFEWDLFKDHKTVVHAGYGIFYSPVNEHIVNDVQTLGLINAFRPIAQVFVPLTNTSGIPSLTAATIFQTLFSQGKITCISPNPGNAACITPADLAQFGIAITHTGLISPQTVLLGSQPDYQNPYSQQASVGIEREIKRDFSVSLSGVYVRTQRLPVVIDTNNLPGAPVQTAILANGRAVRFRDWGAPQCSAIPTLCFADPLLLQNNVYSSQGSALYEGGILEVRKRFNDYVALTGNYTLSKAFDTITDFNSDFGPQDQTNLGAERALSTLDQRHKLVVAAILHSPLKAGKDADWVHRVFADLQLAPIIRYSSGHPFNLLAGTDVNNDRHSTNDRPIGAARNTGRGPDYVDVDIGLTKQIKITENASIQFMIEAFNLFNRTNYGSVNNVVGPNFGLPASAGGNGATTFNISGSNIGPSQPLGFTSAYLARTFQLGLRFRF